MMRIIVLSAFMALAGCSLCAASPFASPNGYTMDIPAGWSSQLPVNGDDALLIAPIYRPVPGVDATALPPSMAVRVAPVPDGMSDNNELKALQNSASQSLISAFPGCQVSGTGPAVLGSRSGFFIAGSYVPPGGAGSADLRRIYVAHNHTVFRLTEMVLHSEVGAVAAAFSSAESSFTVTPFNTSAYTSPYGFQMSPPAGWSVHVWSPPNLFSFVENADEGTTPGSILVRWRNGLNPIVDEQMIADNSDEWNAKYSQEPGYVPIDQGQLLIGGEKVFCTIWSETADPPQNRVRKWHVMYPRDGVLVEIFVAYSESSHRRYDRLVRDCLQSWTWCPPTTAPRPAEDAPDIPSQSPSPGPVAGPSPSP